MSFIESLSVRLRICKGVMVLSPPLLFFPGDFLLRVFHEICESLFVSYLLRISFLSFLPFPPEISFPACPGTETEKLFLL